MTDNKIAMQTKPVTDSLAVVLSMIRPIDMPRLQPYWYDVDIAVRIGGEGPWLYYGNIRFSDYKQALANFEQKHQQLAAEIILGGTLEKPL